MSGLGPAVSIPAPAVGAPSVSLLRSALVINHTTDLSLVESVNPDAIVETESGRAVSIDARWGNGIVFQGATCADATIHDPCNTLGLDTDSERNRPGVRSYFPFFVDAHDRCSTFGWELSEYEPRARQMLAARESEAIAKEFWTGTLIATNPHLADGAGAAVVQGGTAVTTIGTGMSPHNGLAALVQAIADGNGGVGMIHMRPRLLQMLASNSFLRWENGQWYTAAGNKVVADAGYPGTGPTGQAITNPGGVTTEWAFATELVEVHLGPVKVFAPALTAQSIDYQANDELVRAQRLAAPIWNGCVLSAVSITTPATD